MRFVVLCGGSGSRLWPESRERLPKQFIPLLNKKSLLDLTIERFISIKNKKKPIFICNKKHGFLVKNSLNKYNLKADIFLEPEGKNTCAAIYLAAKHCSTYDSLLIMPSDHLIPDNQKFLEDVLNIEPQFILHNLSVNTANSDFGAMYYKDQLIYSSAVDSSYYHTRKYHWKFFAKNLLYFL